MAGQMGGMMGNEREPPAGNKESIARRSNGW
jgi:hypothetical protein